MNNQPLTQEQITTTIEQRRKQLEALKPQVSRKLYYAMEEKLENEEKKLKEILDFLEGRQNFLSQYTLILNPHYFEQEFL